MTLEFIIRVLAHQPACDLLRGPFSRQLGRYCAVQIVIACQLSGLGPMGTVPNGII
tara:strand:- start:3477 stop:3644 length:168 start_codon:yes stop_codon:yes gene_type:complete